MMLKTAKKKNQIQDFRITNIKNLKPTASLSPSPSSLSGDANAINRRVQMKIKELEMNRLERK
jgi:hypothetical protein